MGNQRRVQWGDAFFVIGARLGFDVDLHLPKRFFFGWGLRYEVVKPTGGQAPTSHFVSRNLLPLRMGVDIGRTLPFSSTRPKALTSLELDVQPAQRGRLLLASGVPMLAAGAAGLAVGLTASCHQRDERPRAAVGAGATFSAVGLGLSLTGIVSTVQASKEARKAPMTDQQRRGVTLAATFSSLGSVIAVSIATGFSWLQCNNS